VNDESLPITRPYFDDAERKRVDEVLASGWVTQGPMTARFEKGMAERHEVPHALATTSCTAALHLSTLALGLGPGDEVVVPAFTWVTSAYCARYVGADVAFADVRPETFNLDPAAFEAAITPATRAVVVVHLFGQAAEMDAIREIAARSDIRVIEDAACAVGTTWQGTPVGGLGDLGCFSFHPRKVITTGEGGMVTTSDDELALRVRTLRNHGTRAAPGPPNSVPKPHEMGAWDELGFNLRLSDIQAAVGVAQLAKLDELLAHRIACAHRYDELLAGIDGLVTPVVAAGAGHTYQSYVLRVVDGGRERRNRVMEALAAEGIQTRPGTHAVHRLGYFARKGVSPEAFPNASEAEDTSITLPIFPGMTSSQQERVADAIRRHF
jgi:dTDP-4-amino-4,6-dideoxygalactose transaminase